MRRPGGRRADGWVRLPIAGRVAVAIAALVVAGTVLFPGAVPRRRDASKAVARVRTPPPARPATVTIPAAEGAVALPRSFLGLSIEYWSLPHFERHPALFDRVLSLLRVPGDGPVILRIGGDSADRTFWAGDVRRPAHWVYEVTPRWLRALRAVVRATGVRVIMDLNTITGAAPTAADLAREVVAALPARSIAGFEVGNESDIYELPYWEHTIAADVSDAVALSSGFSAASYLDQFHLYAGALARVAPGVPLIGPVVANPKRDLSWVSTLLDAPHEGLGMVSVHRYPYSACARRHTPTYATIARVLSENASAGVARSVAPAVRLAHRAGLPLRLTELNSITCLGKPGVSDTFATALWAPDTLFELLRAGVSGANIHVREGAINAAFLMGAGGLRARPLLYGLALFARSLGPGARLVAAHVAARPSLHLKAWAVRLRGGLLHVVLIDKGPAPVRVDLRVPGAGPATVERLLAPAVASRSGVTLAAQRIGGDARWAGQPATESVAGYGGRYEILVPRFSAALVTVPVHGDAAPRGPANRVL